MKSVEEKKIFEFLTNIISRLKLLNREYKIKMDDEREAIFPNEMHDSFYISLLNIYKERQGLDIKKSVEELDAYFLNLPNKSAPLFEDFFKPIEVETEKTEQIDCETILYTNLNSFIRKVVNGESESDLLIELEKLKVKVEAYKKSQEEKSSSPGKTIEIQSEAASSMTPNLVSDFNLVDYTAQAIAETDESENPKDIRMDSIFNLVDYTAQSIAETDESENPKDIRMDSIFNLEDYTTQTIAETEESENPKDIRMDSIFNLVDYTAQTIAETEESENPKDIRMDSIFSEPASPAAKESTSPDTDILTVVNSEIELDLFIQSVAASSIIPSVVSDFNLEDNTAQEIAETEESENPKDIRMDSTFSESASSARRLSKFNDIREKAQPLFSELNKDKLPCLNSHFFDKEEKNEVLKDFNKIKSSIEEKLRLTKANPIKVIRAGAVASYPEMKTFVEGLRVDGIYAKSKDESHTDFVRSLTTMTTTKISNAKKRSRKKVEAYKKSQEEKPSSPDTREASVYDLPWLTDMLDDQELELELASIEAGSNSTKDASLQQNSDEVQVTCLDGKNFDTDKRYQLLERFNKLINELKNSGKIVISRGLKVETQMVKHLEKNLEFKSFAVDLRSKHIHLTGSLSSPTDAEYVAAFLDLSSKHKLQLARREKALDLFNELKKNKELPFLTSHSFDRGMKNAIVKKFSKIKHRIIGKLGLTKERKPRQTVEIEVVASDPEMKFFLEVLRHEGIHGRSKNESNIDYIKILTLAATSIKTVADKKSRREAKKPPLLTSHTFNKKKKIEILGKFYQTKSEIIASSGDNKRGKPKKVVPLKIIAKNSRMILFVKKLRGDGIYAKSKNETVFDCVNSLAKMARTASRYIAKEKSESKVEEVSTKVSESEQGPEGNKYFAKLQTRFQEEAQVEKLPSQDEGQHSSENENVILDFDDEEATLNDLNDLNNLIALQEKHWVSEASKHKMPAISTNVPSKKKRKRIASAAEGAAPAPANASGSSSNAQATT
ncbi:hypothetical protein OAC51_08930, partial [Flavobacteriaceae bacterium]|nr:hypothetical protein [Flavobacteriaceae bacterium]